MALAPGTRLGTYEVIRALGAGGPAFVRGRVGVPELPRGFDEAMPGLKASFGPNAEAWQVFETAYQRGGPAAANSAIGDYLAARATGIQNALNIAGKYAEAGDANKAKPWLEKAFAARLPQLLHVPATPAYDPIREDPRFKDLLRRIGIAPARR